MYFRAKVYCVILVQGPLNPIPYTLIIVPLKEPLWQQVFNSIHGANTDVRVCSHCVTRSTPLWRGTARGKTAEGKPYRTCCHQDGRHQGPNDVQHTAQCEARQASLWGGSAYSTYSPGINQQTANSVAALLQQHATNLNMANAQHAQNIAAGIATAGQTPQVPLGMTPGHPAPTMPASYFADKWALRPSPYSHCKQPTQHSGFCIKRPLPLKEPLP